MKRILIVASTVNEEVLINAPICINGDSEKVFIMLSENRIPDKMHTIEYYDTIDECIKFSDVIIAVNSQFLSNKKINNIRQEAEKNQKPLYILDDFSDYCLCNTINTNINYSACPVVLILYSGFFSLQCITEWKISELFIKHKIDKIQLYSSQTEFINRQLEAWNIVHNSINTSCVNMNDSGCKVLIQALNIGSNLEFFSDVLNKFSVIQPDYIITMLRYDQLNSTDYLKEAIKYRIQEQQRILVMYSRYHILPQGNGVICNVEDNDILLTENVCMNNLYEKIVSCISIPNGIVPINIIDNPQKQQ